MRHVRLDKFLAGTMLALIVATPRVSAAAPDAIRQIAPPPPSLNGQSLRRDDATPAQQHTNDVQQPVAREPAKPEPLAQTPIAPEPAASINASAPSTAPLEKTLAADDSQIADRLRDQVKKFDKRIDNLAERKALESYYTARQFAPIWIRDGRLTGNATAAIARLKNASADALDASDYPAPDFAGATSADALAIADIRLTQSIMTFARHLSAGRIAPNRVVVEVDYGSHTPEPADILKRIPEARDINAAFNSFDPPHEGYKALKAKLAELRAAGSRNDADRRIAGGPAIKPGDKDARVPQLRALLHVSLAAPAPTQETMRVRDKRTGEIKLVKVQKDAGKPDELVYDKALFNAVKAVQARADIKPTGVIDGRTLAAINGPNAAQKADAVAATMERWRWLPRDLGKSYVMVNIPDYTLKVVHDDKIAWRTKVVAGRPQTQTPLLTAAMDNVVVNPSWYVPQSIIQNELLPVYASDPQIFERMGLEVKRGPDGHINVVQPPGAANALGRIKFNFPNKFQVYLHDTPEKRLFASERRAYSHGCMRVENPIKFGEVMLGLALAGHAPDARQIEGLVGQDEKIFKLDKRPMVHLTYQTAFVDDAGTLVVRDDIYGFDQRIKTIMHSDERRIADVAPPPEPKNELLTMRNNQEVLSRVERREVSNPFSFFDHVFR